MSVNTLQQLNSAILYGLGSEIGINLLIQNEASVTGCHSTQS
jgi:hypothetical protein